MCEIVIEARAVWYHLLTTKPTKSHITIMSSLKDMCNGLPLDPLPRRQQRDNSVPHAPVRTPNLTADEEMVIIYLTNPLNLDWSYRLFELTIFGYVTSKIMRSLYLK